MDVLSLVTYMALKMNMFEGATQYAGKEKCGDFIRMVLISVTVSLGYLCVGSKGLMQGVLSWMHMNCNFDYTFIVEFIAFT